MLQIGLKRDLQESARESKKRSRPSDSNTATSKCDNVEGVYSFIRYLLFMFQSLLFKVHIMKHDWSG